MRVKVCVTVLDALPLYLPWTLLPIACNQPGLAFHNRLIQNPRRKKLKIADLQPIRFLD
jgi:hypothetical protein